MIQLSTRQVHSPHLSVCSRMISGEICKSTYVKHIKFIISLHIVVYYKMGLFGILGKVLGCHLPSRQIQSLQISSRGLKQHPLVFFAHSKQFYDSICLVQVITRYGICVLLLYIMTFWKYEYLFRYLRHCEIYFSLSSITKPC